MHNQAFLRSPPAKQRFQSQSNRSFEASRRRPSYEVRSSIDVTSNTSRRFNPTPPKSIDPSHPDHIPAPFFELTKRHFRIFKCLHHLEQLQSMPRSLARKERELQALLKPAFTSDTFKSASKSIAVQWANEAKSALIDHYENTLADAEADIKDREMPTILLERSLKLVVKWSRRQLGRRLKDETLDKAVARIQSLHPNDNREPYDRRAQHESPVVPRSRPKPSKPTISRGVQVHSPSVRRSRMEPTKPAVSRRTQDERSCVEQSEPTVSRNLQDESPHAPSCVEPSEPTVSGRARTESPSDPHNCTAGLHNSDLSDPSYSFHETDGGLLVIYNS